MRMLRAAMGTGGQVGGPSHQYLVANPCSAGGSAQKSKPFPACGWAILSRTLVDLGLMETANGRANAG